MSYNNWSGPSPDADPVGFAANVIKEAVGCERAECTPQDHTNFVTRNMEIAHEAISDQPRW